MPLSGTYDCTIQTPLGPQKGALTIVTGEGQSFTGQIAGDLGEMAITSGTIKDQTLHWAMAMTSPMPMDLQCTATIEGDSLNGEVKTPMFGAMVLSGTRRI